MKIKCMLSLLLLLLLLLLIVGCGKRGESMVLLDGEEVGRINVSTSNGLGDINPEIMLSFSDKESIQVFEKAIISAVGSDREINGDPDFDIEVVYQEGLPPMQCIFG